MAVDELGYCIEECVLSSRECDALIQELGSGTEARSRAGLRHLMGHPAVAALVIDRRLVAIAQGVLDSSAVPFRATRRAPRANSSVRSEASLGIRHKREPDEG